MKLRKLRKDRLMTLKELVEEIYNKTNIRVTLNTVHRWETCQVIPRADNLKALKDVFNEPFTKHDFIKKTL